MLAFKLLLRNWRSGELKLLSISLVLAVAVLSGISIFTNRLDTSLRLQSNAILGADSTIESPTAIPKVWAEQATATQVKHSHVTTFESMLYAGDDMILASVKAVGEGFPLRGEVEISNKPFSTNAKDISLANGVPLSGEVWLDSRLFASLHLKIGDRVQVGERQLRASKVLIREPEQFVFNPRLLMNEADLASTKVIQPGGRVTYRFLIASDDIKILNTYLAQLKSQLTPGQEVIDPAQMMERMTRVSKNGKQFLLLSTMIAVLLAGVAIAIAARQFSERHTNQVAMMKSLGVSASRIRQLYFLQLFLLSAIASVIGLGFGQLIQGIVAQSLQEVYRFKLSAPTVEPYVLSFLSGILCIVFFALPALWFLPAVSPLKILRRELAVKATQVWIQALLALTAIVSLIAVFSRDALLTLIIGGGLICMILVSMLIAWVLLAISRLLASRLQGYWRLAFANIYRRKAQNMMQIIVFGVAIMSLLILTIIRSSIMDEWSASIPANADNHFLINIGPDEVADIKSMLDEKKLSYQPIYPSLRARITQINDKELDATFRKKSRTLEMENDVSWTEKMIEGDSITEGLWWDRWHASAANLQGVSVAADSAKNIGLKIGDHIRFSIAGLELDAEVASFRQMTPTATRSSYSFLFEPQRMKDFTPSYTTGFYLAPDQKNFVMQLLGKHPNVAVLELDRMIAQMKSTIKQVTDAVMLVLLLSVAAGGLVMLSAVLSSIEQRKQENGLIRAFGSSKSLILGSVVVEFAVIGALAGSVAIIASEMILVALQTLVLDAPVQPHYLYWLLSPVVSAVLLAALGCFACRHVITTPPSTVLRGAYAS
ncbi:ABC transporter permease [Undibacterium sp. Di24W]|uniref:ABC transporter permease n=1 Tax=Undibacterium sp. Di24W TaxID=3413033 RepID=UPI003BF169A4